MTFAYYAGPEAVKGLQKFHDEGEKVTKNALKELDGILMPEFYKKVQKRCRKKKHLSNPCRIRSTTSSLNSGSQCIWTTRTTASKFDPRKVCTIHETWIPFLHWCAAPSPLLFFSQGHAHPQRGCCTWKACPEGDSWYMGLLAGT